MKNKLFVYIFIYSLSGHHTESHRSHLMESGEHTLDMTCLPKMVGKMNNVHQETGGGNGASRLDESKEKHWCGGWRTWEL